MTSAISSSVPAFHRDESGSRLGALRPQRILFGKQLRRADVAGCHAVDANAVAGKLNRKPPNQSDHAGLGCGVVDVLVPAVGNAHDRRERDDAAFAALAHAGCNGAREAKDAFQVDVEGEVPLVVGECGKRGAMGNAGIGNDDVDAAVPLFQISDQRVGRRCRTDVVIGKFSGATGIDDGLDRGRALALENVGDDDMIALGGKGPGGGLTDADAGTGDDDNAGRLGRIWHVHLSCQSITSPELGRASGRRTGSPRATPETKRSRRFRPARRNARAAAAPSWRPANPAKVP